MAEAAMDALALLEQATGAMISAGPQTAITSMQAKVILPWCKGSLTWHISFHTAPPYYAPDIVFDDPAYQPLSLSASPLESVQLEQLQTLLIAWESIASVCAGPTNTPHSHDPASREGSSSLGQLLVQIVTLLLEGYRRMQLFKLQNVQDERLNFELSTLGVLDAQTTDASILTGGSGAPELLYMEPRGSDPAKACITVPLQGLDMTRVAAVLQAASSSYTPAQQLGDVQALASRLAHLCKLHIVFPLGGNGRSDPNLSLQLAPQLSGPGRPSLPALPPWTPHSCIMEMVPAVTEKLQAALSGWADIVTLKQALVTALCTALGGTPPLDQDLLLGTALWSLACDGIPFLLTLQCGPPSGTPPTSASSGPSSNISPGNFPDDPPLLTITNIRQLGTGPDGGTRVLRHIPWSPRWAPGEMALRLVATLRQEVPIALGTKQSWASIAGPAAAAGGAGPSQPPGISQGAAAIAAGGRLGVNAVQPMQHPASAASPAMAAATAAALGGTGGHQIPATPGSLGDTLITVVTSSGPSPHVSAPRYTS